MPYSADRLSGAFLLLLGLALYFAIIPGFVENAEDGNIAPNTLPNIVSLIIAVGGGWLVIKPTDFQTLPLNQFAKMCMYVLVLGLGIYGMFLFGFVVVAPPLALIIMIMIGERRWYWLVSGVVGMPAIIWFLVTQVLDRNLV